MVRIHDSAGRQTVGANQVYVLDAASHPTPPGVWGALCVSGAAIASSYPGSPEASGFLFVPDPNGPEGRRMWRAQRGARWTGEGGLEISDDARPDDPFEQVFGTYLVLAAADGQLALWPAHLPVPTGWRQVHPEDIRELCVDDPRPALTLLQRLHDAAARQGRAGSIIEISLTASPTSASPHELLVALDTVKKHVSHVLGKLGTANRTEAVARARGGGGSGDPPPGPGRVTGTPRGDSALGRGARPTRR